jgi:hypothetical protein
MPDMDLFFWALGLSVWSIFGAVLLRAAVSLSNVFLRSRRIPEPDFFRAMSASVFICLATCLSTSTILRVTSGGGGTFTMADLPRAVSFGLSLTAAILIIVGMLKVMLPADMPSTPRRRDHGLRTLTHRLRPRARPESLICRR